MQSRLGGGQVPFRRDSPTGMLPVCQWQDVAAATCSLNHLQTPCAQRAGHGAGGEALVGMNPSWAGTALCPPEGAGPPSRRCTVTRVSLAPRQLAPRGCRLSLLECIECGFGGSTWRALPLFACAARWRGAAYPFLPLLTGVGSPGGMAAFGTPACCGW